MPTDQGSVGTERPTEASWQTSYTVNTHDLVHAGAWMLPTPVNSGKNRPFRRSRASQKRLDYLLQRSRATNLAVLLLSALSVLALISNLYWYSVAYNAKATRHYAASGVLSTINRDRQPSHLDHLIVVPCHAIWKGADPAARLNEDNWVLEPYQRGSNRIDTFYGHIERG